MKYKILLFIICFVLLERFCHQQTEGFRPSKIFSEFSFDPRWEVAAPPSEQITALLKQPFTFLGSGGQCYAFVSQDGTAVLKFFKAHHIRCVPWLEKLPLPRFLEDFRGAWVQQRSKRHEQIFGSCKLAYEDFKKETGLLYLHLNKTHNLNQKLTLIDKIGIAHTIELDAVEFALQKRAELAFPTLNRLMQNGERESAQRCLNSLLDLMIARSKRGIADKDPIIKKNFGYIGTEAIEIDIGSFSKNDFLKKPYAYKRELFYETLKLKSWIKQHHPSFLEHLNRQIDEFLSQE
jgi:hypothetical protein